MNSIKHYLNYQNLRRYLDVIKNYFYLSVIIFILGLVVGVLDADFLKEFFLPVFDGISKTPVSTMGFFENNFKVDLIVMFSGFLLAVPSAFILFFNAMIIGCVSTFTNPGVFLLYIVPHGIFEIPALLLAGSISFMTARIIMDVLYTLISGNGLKNRFFFYKRLLKTILVSFILVFTLTVIAAFVEANITVVIAENILSFF